MQKEENSQIKTKKKKANKIHKFFSSLWKKNTKPKKTIVDGKIIPSSIPLVENVETCNNTADEDIMNVQKDNTNRIEQLPLPISKTRVGLVFLLMILIIYNIVLCLERLSLSQININ